MKRIEITNPIHGGAGWELGTCLWSPVRNKGGTRSWEIMKNPKSGDRVYHLVKDKKGLGYYLRGRSTVSSDPLVVDVEPLKPMDWKGMAPYYRIDLIGYDPISSSVKIDHLFETNRIAFEKSMADRTESQFFELKSSGRIQVSQKYLAYVDSDIEIIFDSYFKTEQPNHLAQYELFVPDRWSPAYPDYSPPGETRTTVTRKIRDTKISKMVKNKYDNLCAICGYTIPLNGGGFYSGAHHVKPLGGGHLGPDIEANLIVLCPNHHAEFDYGVMAIDVPNKLVIHKDPLNRFHGKGFLFSLTPTQELFLNYHFGNIYTVNAVGS